MRLSIVVRALVCYDAFDPSLSKRQLAHHPTCELADVVSYVKIYNGVCVCVIMFINVRQHFLHTLVFVS